MPKRTYLPPSPAFPPGRHPAPRPAFPLGTRVRVIDGSERAIQDIRPLDQVVTADGGTGTVTSLTVRTDPTDIINIGAWGHTHLRCAADSHVLTAAGYVQADRLAQAEIALPRYFPQSQVTSIVPSNLVRRYQFGSVELPETIELTPEFGRLMGLWLAEGSADGTKVRWHYGGHEGATLVPETVDLIRKALGADTNAARRPNGTWWVTLYGIPWNELFKVLGAGPMEAKRPHPLLCSGSSAFLEAMLDGWLAGDGHIQSRGGLQGVTVSPGIAMAMFDIAQALGRRPIIRSCQPKPGNGVKARRQRWDVVTGPTARENYSRQDERHVWRRVREVTPQNYAGPLYGLTVPGGNSYVAEGIAVHH